MKIQGKTIRITPNCTNNRGIEGAVNFALSLIKEELVKCLKSLPQDDFEVSMFRLRKEIK